LSSITCKTWKDYWALTYIRWSINSGDWEDNYSSRHPLLKSLSVFYVCPSVSLSQHSLNRLIFLRVQSMLGNWKGATGTSQTDGDVVCVRREVSGTRETAVDLSASQRRPKSNACQIPHSLWQTQTLTNTSCLVPILSPLPFHPYLFFYRLPVWSFSSIHLVTLIFS